MLVKGKKKFFGPSTSAMMTAGGGAGADPFFSNVVLLMGFEGANLLTGSGNAAGGTLTPSGTFAGSFSEDSTTGNHYVSFATTTAVTNTRQTVSVTLVRGSGTHNRFVRIQVVDNPAAITKGFYADFDLAIPSAGVATAIGDGVGVSAMIMKSGTNLMIGVTGICSAATLITPSIMISAASASGILSYAGSNNQCWTFSQAAVVMATGSTALTDESSAAHGAATPSFGAAISAAESKAGISSLWLSRTESSGKAIITFPASGDWNIGAGLFTLECFFQTVALDGGSVFQPLIRGPNNNWVLFFSGPHLAFQYTDGVTPITITDTVIQPDAFDWYYVCVDFDGTKYRLYHNISGVDESPLSTAAMRASSTTLETIASSATVLSIGETATTISDHVPEVYLDEIRFTKGIARYASDSGFAVPTVPFPRH
jgi:hypothetical protein